MKSGFSRLPVYKGKNYQHVTGILLVKSLIVLNPNENIRVGNLSGILKDPLIVKPSYGLLEMLRLFRNGRCHLALISGNPTESRINLVASMPQVNESRFLGIVTLEDVVESILQEQILDETDVVHSPLAGFSNRSRVLCNGIIRI